MDRHALIAGVSGIIGRHLAEHLIATKGWTVTGISRHKHDLPKGVKHLSADLQACEDVKTALAGGQLPGTTSEQNQAYVKYIRRLQSGTSGFTCFASLQMPRG